MPNFSNPNAARSEVVVIDNVAGWRERITDVLRDSVFSEGDTRFHTACDARGGSTLIQNLCDQGTRPSNITLFVDLHMDESGDRPELNGERLIRDLSSSGLLPRVAIVSGTLSQQKKVEFAERLPVPMLEKDAFAPDASPLARTVLLNRLRALIESEAPQLGDLDLQCLDQLADFGSPSQTAVLVDQVKARVANLCANHPELLNRPEFYFLNPHGLYQANPLAGIHEYKNRIALGISAVLTSSATAAVSQALAYDLISFQSWLKAAFTSCSLQSQITEVPDALNSIVAQYRQVAGERLQQRNLMAGLSVRVDPELVHAALSCVIENALLHSSGVVHVRLQDRKIRIINQADPGTTLPFSVFCNEVNGKLPEHSTSAVGTATGLRVLLARLHDSPRLSLRIAQEENLIISEVGFDWDCLIPESVDDVNVPTLSIPLARPQVVFFCHENTPRTTFTSVLGVRIDGVTYTPASVPPQFDWDREARSKFVAMLDSNQPLFEQASLAVAHCGVGAFDTVFRDIQTRFPSVVLYATSSEPDSLYNRKAEKFRSVDVDEFDQILSMPAVREFIKPGDPAGVEEVATQIHCTAVSQPVWETLVLIAGRMSDALAAGSAKKATGH